MGTLDEPRTGERPSFAAITKMVAVFAVVWLSACSGSDDSATSSSVASEDSAHTGGDDDAHEDAGHDHGSADGTAATDDDKGFSLLQNGEMVHEYGPDQPLDAETQAVLDHQIGLARSVAEQYPTLADAKAAGSLPTGAFEPGMGIHMSMPITGISTTASGSAFGTNPDGTLSDDALRFPTSLMYDGTDDDAPIAGLMYSVLTMTEPEGFAGPNDHWHTHSDLCLKFEGGIESINTEEGTSAACTDAGGFFVPQTTYMVHVWPVPAYESERGIFSDLNPGITCSDGTYYRVADEDSNRYQINKCLADAA